MKEMISQYNTSSRLQNTASFPKGSISINLNLWLPQSYMFAPAKESEYAYLLSEKQ